jgi:hypothetical protein
VIAPHQRPRLGRQQVQRVDKQVQGKAMYRNGIPPFNGCVQYSIRTRRAKENECEKRRVLRYGGIAWLELQIYRRYTHISFLYGWIAIYYIELLVSVLYVT